MLRRRWRFVDQLAPRRWRLGADAGRIVTCSVDDEWILLDQATTFAAADVSSLIELNAALPGGLKLAVLSDDSVHLRGEVPVDADADASEQLEAVLTDLARGEPLDTPPENGGYSERTDNDLRDQLSEPFGPSRPRPLSGRIEGQSALVDGLAEEREPSPDARLTNLCTEAGWPGVDRPDGCVAVELEVPGRFQQAIVKRIDEQTRITVDFGAHEPVQTSGSAAVAALLFRVAGIVRLVRVAGDRARLGLGVVLGATPAAADLAHACSALSIACRLCAREVDVLQHDELFAAAYLQSLRHKTATAADAAPTKGDRNDRSSNHDHARCVAARE